MLEASLEEALDRVRHWHRTGGRWHFHFLPAGCRLDHRPGRGTLVLEGPTRDEILAVYGEDDLLQASRELVQWLHGSEILDREQARTTSNEAQIQAILRRAAELNRRGVRWHHHMLFPDCVLNRHPGRWNLVFEDPETGQDVEVLYDEEPVADLRRIEVAYYGQGPAPGTV